MRYLTVIGCVVACVAASSLANAQNTMPTAPAQGQMQPGQQRMGPPGMGGERRGGECRGEVEMVCAGIQPGEGRIRQCIQANMAKFTARCQERFQHREQRGPMNGQMGQPSQMPPPAVAPSGGVPPQPYK